ncbi:MAG: response regulator [Blastocatellia bacterium]|nr:response regulator [Blastocatellia bacterium]
MINVNQSKSEKAPILFSPEKSDTTGDLRKIGSGKMMSLLIVEDNEKVRQLIREMLSDIADTIHECSDGADALTVYTRYNPDWVLMDIEMKQVDGLTATRQIKAAFPDARIVIVTQYNDAKLREAARNAGAAYYVHKEDLTKIWAILLEHKDARNSAL